MRSTDNDGPEAAEPAQPSTADLAFHLGSFGFAAKEAWRLRQAEDDDRADREH